MPNMQGGKPAGRRCANLNDRNQCTIYGRPERPAFCKGWQPDPDVCGRNFDEAMRNLAALERETA